MKRFIGLLILMIVLPSYLFSQTESSVKWNLSLSGGMSLPLGSFGKNDPEGAVIGNAEDINPYITGFQKSKSGFAVLGHYYNAELKLSLPNRIYFFLRSGQFINPVTTDELTRFLTEKIRLQEVEHVDYEIFYLTPGVGYTWQHKNWELDVGLFAGYAQSNYPYYQSILLYTTGPTHPIFAHIGEQNKLNGLTYGGVVQINHKITPHWKIGLESTFQKADFNYSMTTAIIPGFTPNPEFSDTVKASVLNTGLRIGYIF